MPQNQNRDDEETAPPALYDHCRRTYQAMLREAKSVINPEASDEEDSHMVVYEGFLTHLVTQRLNLSVPYYTSVMKNLKRMGCIRQLKRGGGSSPSQWELISEPTEEAFWKAQPTKVPRQTKDDARDEQIRNLSARVSELEGWRKEINEALVKNFGLEGS